MQSRVHVLWKASEHTSWQWDEEAKKQYNTKWNEHEYKYEMELIQLNLWLNLWITRVVLIIDSFSLPCLFWWICAEKRITIHWQCNNLNLSFNLWADSVPPPGELNSTSSTSNQTDAGTNTPPPATRSVTNMPAIKFLTRPDLFSIIQNNEVRLSVCGAYITQFPEFVLATMLNFLFFNCWFR